jgi:hypothetical protein
MYFLFYITILDDENDKIFNQIVFNIKVIQGDILELELSPDDYENLEKDLSNLILNEYSGDIVNFGI